MYVYVSENMYVKYTLIKVKNWNLRYNCTKKL